MEVREEIAGLLTEQGVAAPLTGRLAEYGALLLAANRGVNLTGARDASSLLPHLLDALRLVTFVEPGQTLVDVGSGGGLPGIPLALAAGVVPTLVEPIRKKAAFLGDAVASLGLAGRVVCERAEAAARDPELRERFDRATCRAVAGAATVAELTIPFLRIDGEVLVQRGKMESLEREAFDDACLVLGARVISEHEEGVQQRIVVVRKVLPTPERFPRRTGVPEKRPLGATRRVLG